MKPPTNLRANAAHRVRPGLTRPMTSEERRRAQRVLLRVPVRITVQGKTQAIEGTTHTVSATGALVQVPEALAQGTKVTIENVNTQKTAEAQIPRPAQFSTEGSLVPVEFVGAVQNFWSVFFPPVVN